MLISIDSILMFYMNCFLCTSASRQQNRTAAYWSFGNGKEGNRLRVSLFHTKNWKTMSTGRRDDEIGGREYVAYWDNLMAQQDWVIRHGIDGYFVSWPGMVDWVVCS